MAAEIEQQPLENNESSEDQQQQLSPEIITKHPLQNAWTLWYLEVDRTKAWEDMQNIVSTFDTVEDFWSLYNHIKQPAEIKSGNDYSLFKQGIRPMWEDEANNKGGKWTLVVGRNQKEGLNKLWLDTVLCLIGEAFDHSDEVCGAVVNVRSKGDKISVWTANAANREACMEIGRKLKERLMIGNYPIQYILHTDSQIKAGSSVKVTYQC